MRVNVKPRKRNAPRIAEKSAPGFLYRGGSIPGDPETLFWAKVEKSAECWLWKGYKSPSGYGVHWVSGRNLRAHRFSWQIHNGIIPVGLVVLHSCDVRECVNPDHLKLGTQTENIADMDQKGRRGDLRGERHPAAKLTPEQVRSIRQDGRCWREIAAEYPIGKSGIEAIRNGRTWRHL